MNTALAVLDALLREAEVGEIMLAGLATDFCVLHTALDGRALGYRVTAIDAASASSTTSQCSTSNRSSPAHCFMCGCSQRPWVW